MNEKVPWHSGYHVPRRYNTVFEWKEGLQNLSSMTLVDKALAAPHAAIHDLRRVQRTCFPSMEREWSAVGSNKEEAVRTRLLQAAKLKANPNNQVTRSRTRHQACPTTGHPGLGHCLCKSLWQTAETPDRPSNRRSRV